MTLAVKVALNPNTTNQQTHLNPQKKEKMGIQTIVNCERIFKTLWIEYQITGQKNTLPHNPISQLLHENIVEKEENTSNQHFPLFQQCFLS